MAAEDDDVCTTTNTISSTTNRRCGRGRRKEVADERADIDDEPQAVAEIGRRATRWRSRKISSTGAGRQLRPARLRHQSQTLDRPSSRRRRGAFL
jgi:hypothetical protein